MCLVSREGAGPKFVPDLRQWLAVKIRDIVEATINGRDLVFRELQLDLLLPELIERQVIVRGRFLG